MRVHWRRQLLQQLRGDIQAKTSKSKAYHPVNQQASPRWRKENHQVQGQQKVASIASVYVASV